MSQKIITSAATLKPYLFTILIGVVLMGVVAGQYFVISSLESRVKDVQKSIGGVIDELGQEHPVGEQLATFGRDINEMRAFLYLPQKNYGATTEEATNPEDSDTSKETLARQALFRAVDRAVSVQKQVASGVAAKEHLASLQSDSAFQAALAAQGVSTAKAVLEDGDLVSLSLQRADGALFRRLTFHRDTGEWEIFSPQGASFYKTRAEFDAARTTLAEQLPDLLAKDVALFKTTEDARAFLLDKTTRTLLDPRGIKVEGLQLRSATGATVAELRVTAEDAKLHLIAGSNDTSVASVDELRAVFPGWIAAIDARSETEKRVAAQQALLASVFTDPAFIKLLTEGGLTVDTEPRVTDDRLWYALRDSAKNVRLQIVIERNAQAALLVVDAAGLNPQPLESLLEDERVKKKSPSLMSSPN